MNLTQFQVIPPFEKIKNMSIAWFSSGFLRMPQNFPVDFKFTTTTKQLEDFVKVLWPS